jgi:hypothetical protein
MLICQVFILAYYIILSPPKHALPRMALTNSNTCLPGYG